MRELAKLAPELGERLGKFGVLPLQTGSILCNLSKPQQKITGLMKLLPQNQQTFQPKGLAWTNSIETTCSSPLA